jgi:urease accessory protein
MRSALDVGPPPGGPIGKHGYLHLRTARLREVTTVEPVARRIPFQWQGVHYQDHDDQPFVLLHHSAGGYVEDDTATLHVDVAADTRVLLTTMGATKFYKSCHGGVAEERVLIDVGPGALAEYLPDEVIPYAGSRVSRTTTVNLTASSSAFVTDLLAAGRIHYADGEAFAFDGLRSELRVTLDDRLLVLDRLMVDDEERDALRRLWAGRNLAASVVAHAPGVDLALEAEIEETCAALDVRAGASRRQTVLFVRLLAHEAWQLHEAVHQIWCLVRPQLAGKAAPRIRKC